MKDFIFVIDTIFKNRHLYKELTDEDKISNFFKVNHKLSKKYPKAAQFFNNKNIDKASATDRWYLYFENSKDIPAWYWDKKKTKDENKEKVDKLMKKYEFKQQDAEFLLKYFKIDF